MIKSLAHFIHTARNVYLEFIYAVIQKYMHSFNNTIDHCIQEFQSNPAWLALMSPIAPVLMVTLSELFRKNPDGIQQKELQIMLADALKKYGKKLTIDENNVALFVKDEIKYWLSIGLIDRENQNILPGDPFYIAKAFLDNISKNRLRTSTAARFNLVYDVSNKLVNNISLDGARKQRFIENQIDDLKAQLIELKKGNIEQPNPFYLESEIIDFYQLAYSLTADFAWFEKYYRENNQAELVATKNSIQKKFIFLTNELKNKKRLHQLKSNLREIIAYSEEKSILNSRQRSVLKWLILNLLNKTKRIFYYQKTKNKSYIVFDKFQNDDVLIDENDIFLLNKYQELDDLFDGISEEKNFWMSIDEMNRNDLLSQSIQPIKRLKKPMSIKQLLQSLPQDKKMEAIFVFLDKASQVGFVNKNKTEHIEIEDENGQLWGFSIPCMTFDLDDVKKLNS